MRVFCLPISAEEAQKMNDDHDEVPVYRHPPEGPEDITPADEVYRHGDEVIVIHGPGDQTRVDADEFYE